MKEFAGAPGLILNEPLLLEKGKKGRCGFSLPRRDVESCPVEEKLLGEGPNFPDLSEGEIVRIYSALDLELRPGLRDVSPGLMHHEIQSQDQ